MSKAKPVGGKKNVTTLEAAPAQPNPQRIAAVRNWHIDQATESNDRPVAALAFSVTESGMVRIRDVGIEPEHSPMLLLAIARTMKKLQIEIADHHPDPAPVRRRRQTDAVDLQTRRLRGL